MSAAIHEATDEKPVHITAGESRGLPTDLVDQGSRRLGIAALLYAVCYSIAYGAAFLSGGYQIFGVFPVSSHVVAIGSILLSLAVFAVSRSSVLNPQQLCDLGLIYEVVGALAIDYYLVLFPITPDVMPLGISWVGVWIMGFVFIVPNPPGKTLLAALASASVTPLMLLIGMARGSADPSMAALIQWILPNFLCAGLAFVGSLVIYRMGKEVREARLMGSYQLVKRLGGGGMGEVWRARHRALARPSAIKLIRPSALDGTSPEQAAILFKRFEREAKVTARLRSPHTITLYDFGITDAGSFYYVMELLHGLDLYRLVRRFGPIPPERSIFLLRQICHSLGEAHQNGLIHRDVKPANIYLCRLGPDYDFIKVLDFGLVKSMEEAGVDQGTQLTTEGSAPGTPTFMAPEMALGKSNVDARADIYAVGCVAYWMLTGAPLFEGETPMETILHHVKTSPAAPSVRSEFEVPAALDSVILGCLEKEPAQRPADMAALRLALERIPNPGVWGQAEARVWWRRHLPELNPT